MQVIDTSQGSVSKAQEFLASIADGVRTASASGEGIAVVLAHPDDETLACGVGIARLHGVLLVIVTDGSPKNGADARAKGFRDASAYAAARKAELESVADMAGIGRAHLITFDVPDQAVSFGMTEITRRLVDLFAARNIDLVLTHAYEGGHPDHDGVAFAVHAAAALSERGGAPVELIEMPLYRLADKEAHQSFFPIPDHPETVMHLGNAERAIKQAMADAHVSQADVIAGFDLSIERFRRAPAYDFSVPPNAGRVLYSGRAWGMRDGREWSALAMRAADELGLGEALCRGS